MSAVTVTVDRLRCCGAGLCVQTAPTVFDQDDDGTVRLLTSEPPEELLGDVEEAVDMCPAQAISIS